MGASLVSSFFSLLLILASPSTSRKLDTNITNQTLLSSSQTFDSLDTGPILINRILEREKYNSLPTHIPIILTQNIAVIFLSFGTPPQTLPFILDTGSSLTWFPCDSNYSYYNSNYFHNRRNHPIELNIFNQKLSSSSKFMRCNHPRSSQSFHTNKDPCRNCKSNNSQNCLGPVDYKVVYEEGYTTGVVLLETLKIQQSVVQDFLVGCSSSSSCHFPFGIVGFSRGLLSLPSQLGIKKFSYCLSSGTHFNQNPIKSNYLVFSGASHDSRRLSYMPLLKSPSTKIAFQEYYYVVLKNIVVGHKSIEIPHDLLEPRHDGNGGTILDSGTSYTVMEGLIFQAVIREFGKQLRKKAMTVKIENTLSCFNTSGMKLESIPKIALEFKFGAKMELPLHNYLVDGNDKHIVCLSILRKSSGVSSGPAIILGNVQLRDFVVEYDLKNERFGFRAEKCILT